MQSGQLSSFQVSNSRGSPSSIAPRKPNAHYRHPTQPVEDQLTDDQVDQKHEFQTRPTDQNANRCSRGAEYLKRCGGIGKPGRQAQTPKCMHAKPQRQYLSSHFTCHNTANRMPLPNVCLPGTPNVHPTKPARQPAVYCSDAASRGSIR